MNKPLENTDAVEMRFRLVSPDNPVNKMLLELALEDSREEKDGWSFASGMHHDLPDVDEYLALKRKISLLPLESLKTRIKLPSIPAMIIQLQQAMDENASSDEMAGIIRNDPKLSTAIMSLVNSPLYSLPNKIETLSRAVTIIGTREISTLALGARMLAMFEDSVPSQLPLETFWRHSIACAVMAHGMAVLCARRDPEKYFMAGLLHDLGRVMLFSRYPEVAGVALSLQAQKGMTLREAELWLFDVDHAMVGGIYFGEWGLPKNIVHTALYHHDPQRCLGKDVPEIVYVANQLATALGMGSNRIYNMNPGERIWEKLGLDKEALRGLLDHVDDKLKAVFCSLFPDSRLCKI